MADNQNRTKCPPKGTQSAAAYILNCKDAVPIVLTTMLLAMSLLLLIQLPARSEAGTWTSRENTPPPTGNKTFLVLHPLYTGSHVLTLHQITKELIARGHRVVTVRFRDVHNFTLTVDNHQGAMGEGSRRNNFEDILMSVDNSDGSLPYLSQEAEAKFSLPSQVLWAKGDNYVQGFLATKKPFEHGIKYCDTLLGDKALIRRLKREKFDLAIVDLIYNECGLALAHHLGAPAVGFWAFSFTSGEPSLTTAWIPSSYIPSLMSGFTNQMSFFQRLQNFLLDNVFSRLILLYHLKNMDQSILTHLPGSPLTFELLAELNGALINSDNVLDYPRLQPETFINIGGVQIQRPPTVKSMAPLTKDQIELKTFMDEAPNGVILFSLGFIFDPEYAPQEQIDTIFKAFSNLGQNRRFIVKFGLSGSAAVSLPSMNSNILVRSFVPQQEVLAHPNTVLFFTHCGMHSILETIYYAVPVVGMPIFLDQSDVLARVEQRGIGVGVNKWASAEDIITAMDTVLNNTRYKQNVERMSKLMKAEPRHPMDRAIEMLEYLADTRGAEHLKLDSRHLSFITLFSLDVIATLVITLASIIYFLYRRWIPGKKGHVCSKPLQTKHNRNKQD